MSLSALASLRLCLKRLEERAHYEKPKGLDASLFERNRPPVSFLLFGLSGGIASGKSTVARRFRERGLVVIDADEIAREVVAKGSEGLSEIIRTFGDGVLAEDGSLDRKALARIAFADELSLKKLEQITHPRISMESMRRAQEARAAGHRIACYEAALLVERGLADAFRPLVIVSASEARQVARAMARDEASEDEVRARMRAQLPMKEKALAADYLIENEGSIEELLARADEVLDAICEAAAVDPKRYPKT